jgi:phosphoadenosine phosphosulfate reductase
VFKDVVADTDLLSDYRDRETMAESLDCEFPRLTAVERLRRLAGAVSGRLTHTTSFGLEGQVLVHLIVEAGIEAEFVTLDTGRLFPETYDVWGATEERYGIRVRGCHPDASAVEALVDDQGINGFRDGIAARKACCALRKLNPLNRALAGSAAWITGLRADQSVHRATMRYAAYDAPRRLIKVNPLLDWTRDQAAALVAAEGIPVNSLHAQGFLSIGCTPCTRAVRPGEPERAGRWWWENGGNQECGLHVTEDGRLVRRARSEPDRRFTPASPVETFSLAAQGA